MRVAGTSKQKAVCGRSLNCKEPGESVASSHEVSVLSAAPGRRALDRAIWARRSRRAIVEVLGTRMGSHSSRWSQSTWTARGLGAPAPTELFGPAGTPRVVIVGAGFGGIAAGVKLKQAGIHTFTIYESSPGIGGTWWDNTYPGAEVDVGSHLYSFSFQRARLVAFAREATRAAAVPRSRPSTSSGYDHTSSSRRRSSRRRGTTTVTSGPCASRVGRSTSVTCS